MTTMRHPSPTWPASATSTPSSSTWRRAGGTAGWNGAAWYQVPVFYFSNPAGVIGDEAAVWAPRGSQELDYELELACVIGREARDLPADDRALECRRGLHDHERLERARPSARRDGRRAGAEQRQGLRDVARPELVTVRRAGRLLPRRPVPPGDDRRSERPRALAGKRRVRCTGRGRSCSPTPAATRRSGPAT